MLARPARAQVATSALEDSLARLSEILGALHYLRGICDSGEGNRWRNEMQALIDAEGTTPERKARMVAGFNRGFQRLSADLPDLHGGRRHGHPPVPRRRRQAVARGDGPLQQLGAPDIAADVPN